MERQSKRIQMNLARLKNIVSKNIVSNILELPAYLVSRFVHMYKRGSFNQPQFNDIKYVKVIVLMLFLAIN